jgi:hypothetical protein
MTTEISYVNEEVVKVECSDLNIFCMVAERREINRRHEGVWNSRVLAFVSQQKYDTVYLGCNHTEPCNVRYMDGVMYVIPTMGSADTFSDGTPVASYEGWN